MKLIVGLGNPDPKYETTRHNAGFLVVDDIAERFGFSWQESKFKGVLAKGKLFSLDVLLLKPMAYMNLSGKSVALVSQFFKIPASDIIVLFDDIDLEQGVVKARVGGGAGGHNGIKSILEETGMSDFHRIKIGVGRPEKTSKQSVASYVLDRMNDQELLALQNKVYDAVMLRLQGLLK